MSKSLKSQNSIGLFGLMAANLALYYTAVQKNAIIAADWAELATGIGVAVPAGVGIALTGIFNSVLPADVKARIVFMRWKNPLPGSEAFTRHAKMDDRVSLERLSSKYSPLPEEPRRQNELWYRLYRTVQNEPAVLQAHRSFLFSRDYACLSILVLAAFSILGLVQIESNWVFVAYLGVLTIQFLIACVSARNHGNRFVSTVLAIKSAETETPE